MDKRVKFFFDEGIENLERKINYFLSSTKGKLIDIKYDAIINIEEWGPSALLIYIPEEFIKERGIGDEKEEQGEEKGGKGDERVQEGSSSQRKQRRTCSEQS